MAKCLDGLEFILLAQPGVSNTIVMQVNYPHVVGQLVFVDPRSDKKEALMRSLANGDVLSKVSGYSIFVLPGGTLDKVSVDPDQMKMVLAEIATYVLDEVISVKESRCLKYKENINYEAEKAAQVEKGRYYKQLREARRAAKFSQEEE